jgi:hypothetical protein
MPSAYQTAFRVLQNQNGICGKADLMLDQGNHNLIRIELNGKCYLLNLDALLTSQTAPIFRG